MKRAILLGSLYFTGLLLYAQSQKYPVLNIPVQRNGVQMRLPWSGGMDSPQFSYIDMDGDGVPDLFVFDKAAGKGMVYINTGGIGDTAYRYAPEYEDILPQGLIGWALMRDYNHDGIPDLFTHTGSGTRVFKGSRPNGFLHFDLVCPLLKYISGNLTPNLWTNIEDIPIITDVNGDGDLDILTYTIFGTSVNYFENQTEEHAGENNPYYDIDSFRYMLVNTCWGNFTQNAANNSIVLNDTDCTKSSPCTNVHVPAPPGTPGDVGDSRHVGNSMYAIYPYGDTIFSILNGNIGFETLMFLRNCATSNSCADMCVWDSLYPLLSCTTPVIIASYPGAFGVHVNGNPKLEDLLTAPCSDWRTGFNVNNVWQYNNTGDMDCVYSYQGDTFLVEHMPDFGTDSKPVFYDMNGDSLLDMMIGNLGYFVSESVYKSTIAYYQNVGTATQPKFRQITDDYDSISKFGLVSVSPAFGDLNGDGKPDMVIGEVNGWLHYFKNQGTGTASSFPIMTTPEYFHLQEVNGYSTPFIYDVNGDGLNDLIVGSAYGTLSYYWNYGTKDSAVFSMDSSNHNFGTINVTPFGDVYGFSQPYIMKDTSGNLLLFVGSSGGTVAEFIINPDSLRPVVDSFSYYTYSHMDSDSVLVYADSLHYPAFVNVNSNFLGHYVGTDVFFSAGDITNTGHLNYLVGCEMGGLLMFSDSLYDSINYINSIPLLHMNELEIFPNPTRDNFTCTTGNVPFINPQVEVYNILGEIVPAKVSIGSDKVMVFTTGLINGFYLVRISDQNKSYEGKVLLQR